MPGAPDIQDTSGSAAGRGGSAPDAPASEPSPAKPHLSQTVVDAIEREIVERGWPIGASLGSEPELCARFSIGRGALRQAIRQLESHGVATMRRGRGGGLIVSAPARTATARTLATYLELSDVGWAEMFEARTILERHAALLAAERIDEDGIGDLRRLHASLKHLPNTAEERTRLRGRIPLAIAELTRNPAILLFVDTGSRLGTEIASRYFNEQSRVFVAPDVARMNDFQSRALDAVIAGDGALAAEMIREALACSFQMVEKIRAEYQAGAAISSLEIDGLASPILLDRAPAEKLGITTALAIRRDITRAGWAAGARLGQEDQLRARYGVSREVFRETLAILKYHSVVKTRRGRSGGLEVCAPDPAPTIASAITYLRYMNFPPGDLSEARKAIEVAAAPLIARRASAEDIRTLRSIADRDYSFEASPARSTPQAFHQQLSEMSGNRILFLYTEVLRRVVTQYRRSATESELNGALRQSHLRLVLAIEARDETLARRRMIDVLATIDELYRRVLR